MFPYLALAVSFVFCKAGKQSTFTKVHWTGMNEVQQGDM